MKGRYFKVGKKVEALKYSQTNPIQTYKHDISAYPLLSHEEHAIYTKRAKAGDINAFKLMMASNVRLVFSIAKKYIRPNHGNVSYDLLDLIQEGCFGLAKAIKKYKPETGYRFTTYATWWIRQAIIRAMYDTERSVRVPVHVHERKNKINQAAEHLRTRLRREPTAQEIAQVLDFTEKKVSQIIDGHRSVASLSAGMDNPACSLENIISTEQDMDHRMLSSMINDVLDDLSIRERFVLKYRFGLGDTPAYTLEEVGKRMGVTRERVRQIQQRALNKLRHPSRSARFTGFL